MSEPIRIEIYADPCPVLDHSNPAYLDVWRQLDQGDRRQFVDGLVARSIFPVGPVDLGSSVPPVFQYPPWHACVTSGQVGDGGSYDVRDEAERARAAAAAAAGYAGGTGSSPLPGLGLLANVPDWLKWLAIAGIVLGTVIIVRRRRAA